MAIATTRKSKELAVFGYEIHVNSSRASPMHAHVAGVWQLQIWFTFPIAVTVVLSLRLSSEHAKLSLSSSSARTILSRELNILTARSSRFSDHAGRSRAPFQQQHFNRDGRD